MDTSNVSVLSSSLAWPTCTSTVLPSIHTNKPSTVNGRTSPQAVVLKGVSVPIYQIAQQEGQQTPFQLTSSGTSFAVDNANLSVMFTPQPILQKSPSQTLMLNIVNTLPVLSPSGLIGASPGKSKNTGKHICVHCGRDCFKPSVLEKHIRSHTGERPFPCTICGISFKTQSNLYKHRRTQTHVNNAKQSFHSDCGSCQEDTLNGRVGDNPCLNISNEMGDVCIDKDQHIQLQNLDCVISVQENANIQISGNKDVGSMPSSAKNHEKALGDPDPSSDVLNQQRSLKDQKSTTTSRHAQLQRQHETCVDKQWVSSPSERKLKKCESTDSGYLSHSDSADLQMFSGSPLHSLSECSIESEHMLSIGTGDSEDRTASSKKNLEEHISMLISQNKAVVDNTHLDNVRPRKTALSKQGSIDLPMPYTFKDSFHFDIKSLDVNRKKVSLCSAKPTFTPPEKIKPLFFHSVPTQISTSMDGIILARSNSLPFVESGRVSDRLNISKAHCVVKQPLNANVLLSNTATACTVDFSSSHPRGLVRQAAVDEMQISNVFECNISQETKEKKNLAGDQIASKSKASNKKGGQKKTNMFSHEKWQMYGDETFKKFYQKIKKNDRASKTKQDIPESKGVSSHENCLQTTCGLAESSATPPQVTPPTSNLQFTCTSKLPETVSMTSKKMEAHTPTENVQNNLGLTQESRTILSLGSLCDTGGHVCMLETELPSDLNISNAPMDCPQHLLASLQLPSIGSSDNPVITASEKQSQVPSVSNIHHNMEACCIGSCQNSEQSPSHRKKLKVAKMKGESTADSAELASTNETSQATSILNSKASLESTEDTDVQQSKNVDFTSDIGNTARQLLDGASTIPCPRSLSTIGNENFLPSLGEDCGKTTAHFSNYLSSLPPQSSSAQKGNLFSPRYLIKFHYTGSPIEASTVVQADMARVSGISTGESDLLNLTEDTNSKSVLLGKAETCHRHCVNQVELTQKHDSVIAPFGKISLNTGYIPTCASKTSIHLAQNLTLDTQGSSEQKISVEEICPERLSKIQEHTAVPTASNTLYYKDSIHSKLHCRDDTMQQKTENDALNHRLISPGIKSEEKPCSKPDTASGCSDHMSTSAVNKHSQDPWLLFPDRYQTGLSSWNPDDPMVFQDQKSSLCSTTHLRLQSGICNVRVTKVAFSPLNTEPKSTWCWLDRCLPLPAEQKEKSFSVYASLSCNTVKDRRPVQAIVPLASNIDKDWLDRTTLAEQPPTSSLLWRLTTQKDCLEEIKDTDVGKSQSLPKRSSKMGALTKSRHIKRSKDSARGSPHGKVSQHMTERGLRQDQRQNKIRCSSNPESGEIFLWTGKDKEDSITTMNPLTLQPGDKREERECKAGLEGQMNEGTISASLLSADTNQLVTGDNKHRSPPSEEMAHLEFPRAKPINWQKSCNDVLACSLPKSNENSFDQVTTEIKRVHLQQDLRDSPPQKHGRKILHRSKTIGHSLGDDTIGANHDVNLHSSMSLLPFAGLSPTAPVESREDVGRSLQNTRESPGVVCGHSDRDLNTNNSGAPLVPGELSLSRNPLSHNHGDPSGLPHQSPKSQKKLNLEVMRKQTHVEYSDTSSDDEDRLYIEI